MRRRWLTYCLLVLFAMQSVAASVDMYHSHQAGTKHVDSRVVHNLSLIDVFSADVTAQVDACCECHHCLHCHCTMNHALLKTFSVYISFIKISVQNRYVNLSPTSFTTTFYRPPKA